MADDAEDQAPEAGADGAEGEPKKKKLSGKKLVLFIVLPLLLLGGGGGAAMMLLGGGEESAEEAKAEGSAEAEDKAETAEKEEEPKEEAPTEELVQGEEGEEIGKVKYAGSDLIFFELPDMIVNLNTTGSQPRFLKVRIALEFGEKAVVGKLRREMPRIIDHFQIYLRELRREDLRGSAGMYRLKEELMIRVNQSVEPARIRDVLFKEMLVQ